MYWGGELFWEELTTQGSKIEMPKRRAIAVTGENGNSLKNLGVASYPNLSGGEL